MIYSMDVKALYPSMQSEMVNQAIRESVELSKLKWKNIDVKYLTRYIALTPDTLLQSNIVISRVLVIVHM